MVEPLNILVFWTGSSGRHPADMCDIGVDGCYLNTTGVAVDGEWVTVEIPETPGSSRIVTIRGQVISQQRKFVGFGLKFESRSESETAFIQSLMEHGHEIQDRRAGSELTDAINSI